MFGHDRGLVEYFQGIAGSQRLTIDANLAPFELNIGLATLVRAAILVGLRYA